MELKKKINREYGDRFLHVFQKALIRRFIREDQGIIQEKVKKIVSVGKNY